MSHKKCGFIVLLGAPNAGKSTLVNQLVGSKVSIVSPKVQTTRASIKGICMEGDTQLVFIDTPGVFSPKKNLEKAIVKEAWSRIHEADNLALLVDVKKGICHDTELIIDFLKKEKKKATLIINKVDLVGAEILLPFMKEMGELGVFGEIFMISAMKGDGVKGLKKHFCDIAPEGEWAYPPDHLSDAPVKFFAAEVTREKLFMKLQHELPYSIAVETEKWEEQKNGNIAIHQVIYTQKDGQKSIILGKGGSMIKEIGMAARKELEKLLEAKIHLTLFVKVREDWVDRCEMGYE